MIRAILERLPSKKRLVQWGGTIIAIILFFSLLGEQDWGAAWAMLRKLPVWILLIAFLLYVSGMLANALRWYVLLRAAKISIPFFEVVKIVFLGAFASNFLPSTIGGDAVRFLGLLRFTTDRALGLSSVILDRLVNLAAMITVLPFSFWTFGSPFGLLNRLGFLSLPGAVFAMAKTGGIKHWYTRSPISRWIVRGRDTFRVWLSQPGFLLLAFLVSWLSVFVVFVGIWVIAYGLDIPVTLFQVMGVTAVTYLITLIPISVNGFGVREVAVTALYVHLGGTLEQASTLAVITRLIMLVETLPGAIWLPEKISGIKSSSIST